MEVGAGWVCVAGTGGVDETSTAVGDATEVSDGVILGGNEEMGW